ncbi:hypothetical protein LCGC14_0321060 [marine sediment metagenome]|uniref:Uncharacterized protein n=1 Tax=marine sediment metagenome TaxID=412755 RepID=A0A0F9TPP7_9ZZZZ|nr:hypothetical protein [Phycisphaerae bacterium]HDZ43128.1 hypothetical protein [Phycisphaerae bacterium]
MTIVDFLPEHIRIQRARRRRLIREGYLLAICLVTMVALGYVRHGRIAQAQGEVALLAERSTTVQAQLSMRADLEAQQAELRIKQRIDEHLGSRVSALDILGELQQLTSARLTLTSMTIHVTEFRLPVSSGVDRSGSLRVASKGELELPAYRRVRLVVTGLAPSDIDVANFIGQLAASPLFEDVRMGYTKTVVHEHHEAREFQVSCLVVR